MLRDTSYFRRSIVRQILGLVLFVFSIAATISLETWVKIFSNIFGYSIVTTIQVLIVFLFGSALGAFYFGKKTDDQKNEIRAFLLYNLILIIYTIILLIIFPLLTPSTKLFFIKTHGNTAFLNLFTFCITLTLLIYPSSLIGGALPTISRYFIQSPSRVSYEIGSLSSLFFGGTSVGCILTSFVLYPIIGVKQSLVLSALLFLFCAFTLKILLNNIEPRILLENQFFEKQLKLFSREIEGESRIFRKLINIALLLLGLSFSSFMLLWIRCGYFVLDAKIYSSKVLLIITFVGFSIGSLIYSRYFHKHKKIYPGFALLPIALSACAILLVLVFPLISGLNQNMRLLFSFLPYWNLQLLIYFLNAVLIVLFPGFLIGMGFVLANRILLINLQNRSQIIGLSVFYFSLGSLLGLITSGFFLLPSIGIQKSIVFLSIINFVAALSIMFAYSFQYDKIKKPSLVFLGVIFIVFLSFLIPSNFIHKIYLKNKNEETLIYAKEGLHTTVTINKKIKTNYLSFASNDVTIGERPAKRFLVKQILAHLPLFLHPKPDSVLLIGFGEGEIARKILLHQIKYFDCIEKSPCLVQAASIFNNSKKILTGDPEFHLITMNENTYVKITDKKYNVIISNCFHPAFVGINRFFSKDFFQSCKNILTSPGILAIPVPMYGLSIEDFKILLRTFYEIFPSTSVWYNNNSYNQHVMLVGRKNLLNEINVNQLQLRITKKAIKNDLPSTGLETIYEALDCFLMGPGELNKLTMGVRINSKNNPVLEFSTPQVTNNPKTINHILQLLKSYREPIYPYIAYIDSSIKKRDDLLRILDNYFKSSDKVLDAISSQLLGRTNQTLTFYQQAYMLNRDDRAAKLFLDKYYDPYLSPSPKSPFEFTENAKIYFQKTEYETAIASLEHAINLDKNYSPAFFALGLNYEMLGDFKIAKQMYQKTLQLQPGLENVQNRLKVVEEMLENMKF